MKKHLTALLLLLATPGFALISNLNQSINESVAVLRSKEVGEKFAQNDQIVELKRTGNQFVIATKNSQLCVDLVYSPTTRVGPKEYTLTFHEVTARK